MNQKGFALAITMALLPVLLGLFLLLFAILGVNQFNLSTQQACREGGLRGQQNVSPLLQQLLALNPRAINLKIAEYQAQLRLASAISLGNPPAIAAARTHLSAVQLQRKTLDLKQKQIIQQSNLLLVAAHNKTAASLRLALSQGLPTFNYLKIDSRQYVNSAPKLAVRPESSDMAPVYRTVENFDTQQALVHSWQYQLRVRSPFQNFLMADLKWSPSCAVTLKQDGFSWIPKIKKVKSW